MEAIKSFNGEYLFLSNFYKKAPLVYKSIWYANSEAAFQAQKVESDWEKQFFSNLEPKEAKKRGRLVTLRQDVDWNTYSKQVMYEVVYIKFLQNPDIREKLLATGDAYLEEGNRHGDKIWGTVNGVGENHLGKILMRVREEMREIENAKRQCERGGESSEEKD